MAVGKDPEGRIWTHVKKHTVRLSVSWIVQICPQNWEYREKKYPIFGEGGVEKTAKEFKKEFLGEIPIDPEVGKQGDLGIPIVESDPDHKISKIYLSFAEKIKSMYI